MEFKIQRYQGKDDDETNDQQADLFQKRIEERRLKRKSQQPQISVDESTETEPKKKKKKKKSIDNENEEVRDNIAENTDTTVEEQIKKKKKKKSRQSEGVGDQGGVAGDEVGIEISTGVETTEEGAKKKKKKKKKSIDPTETVQEQLADEQAGEMVEDGNQIDEEQTVVASKVGEDDSKIVKSDETETNDAVTTDDSEFNNTDATPEDDLEVVDGAIENTPLQSSENTQEQSPDYFPILGKHAKPKKTVVKRTLPRWLSEPVFIPADIHTSKVGVDSVDFLSENILKNLKSNNIEYLFPVQAHVMGKMSSQNKGVAGKFPPRDLCVQAPTGSGKTLAYVLPTLDVLSKFLVRQLYCLVVVPSKDLAVQVYKVFETYITGTDLKVGVASGLKTFSKEQEKLVSKTGSSKVDILVCTPGRLVDHLKQTPGFHLRHLRFLVVDEADRLLGQDYSSWLEEVKTSVYSSIPGCTPRRKLTPINPSTFKVCQLPFQKLLFSATLTQNPEKIAPLELFHPLLFTSKADHVLPSENDLAADATSENQDAETERFIIPEKLSEKMIVTELEDKPLVLVYLMLELKWKGVLCFTKSIESTHRLRVLMQAFTGFTVAEFSSSFSETQRKGIIRDFNSGKVDLLISSDAMARGMDIDTVKLVVNYDTAVNGKTYVHRVGRTARAGKEGSAITLLSSKEVFHFKLMMKKLSREKVARMNVTKKMLESYQDKYTSALSTLQETISLEHKSMNAGSARRT